MSLFDQLVDEAMTKQSTPPVLRPVVEKELLHHDILREMSWAGLLKDLTFMGGTCLRACYGSNRLSEDLDFTAGVEFDPESLNRLSTTLVDRIQVKYNLKVDVTCPEKHEGNVSTWKLKMITHPNRVDLPTQRIHVDICSVPSYERRPSMLKNRYGVNMGTSGLIIQIESLEEILADKWIALALRPNRIKNRDLWDIVWLNQQGVSLRVDLLRKKIADHKHEVGEFKLHLHRRCQQLSEDAGSYKDFTFEMRRFLPPIIVTETVDDTHFWNYLTGYINDERKKIISRLAGKDKGRIFNM